MNLKTFYLDDCIAEDRSFDLAVKTVLNLASKEKEPCKISISCGEYDSNCDDSSTIDIHVSNTIGEGINREKGESMSIERRSPFLMQDMENITIDGSGSLIRSHGKMTQIILKNCKNITFQNMTFDYVNPTVTEMTVVAVGENFLDCKILPCYPYRIKKGRIEWYGDNFSFSTGISQLYDPNNGFTWRYYSPLQDENASFEEIQPGLVRLHYIPDANGGNPYGAGLGYVFQMRDPLRDECGIIVSDCEDISFRNVTMHFMAGLGLIAQNTENITLNGFRVFPSVGRTASCSADFMHFSGCRGTVRIENGYFVGAHDDAINVHGTHLKITQVDSDANTVKIRFMHPQSYGFGGFRAGDTVGLIDPETLQELKSAKIRSVRELNAYDILLTLDDTAEFREGFMVENISATAAVVIRRNHFERIPTRGILVTTRKPVLIKQNEFCKIKGCCVLVADDARSWYESGRVTDVNVCENIAYECCEPFLVVEPECVADFDGMVHSGIQIKRNLITLRSDPCFFSAKNTNDVLLENNFISGSFAECTVRLTNVDGYIAVENLYNGRNWSED